MILLKLYNKPVVNYKNYKAVTDRRTQRPTGIIKIYSTEPLTDIFLKIFFNLKSNK